MPEGKKYPFKFLDSYQQSDADIFFGRDDEIKTLYELVSQNNLVLVYGASGTGKTSLIQCGLASKFRSYDWLPVIVRRGKNINDSLALALDNSGGNSADAEKTAEDESEKNLTPLARKIKSVYRNHFKTIYLVFEQFEELYTIDYNNDEEVKVIESIKEILASKYPVKIIFSIREEYLGSLDRFEKEIPRLLRKKLRVESATSDNVTRFLEDVNRYPHSNFAIKQDEFDDISKGIFDRIKGNEKTVTIQLPYLQVYLDKLYMEATHDETRQADALITKDVLKRVGNIGDVLRNFLEEQVQKITNKIQLTDSSFTTETAWKILLPFSTLEGTKAPIAIKDFRVAGVSDGIVLQALKEFTNSRILRDTGNGVYEVTHDSLALRISEKRSIEQKAALEVQRQIQGQVAAPEEAKAFFSEKQLNYFDHYLNLKLVTLTPAQQDYIDNSRLNVEKLKQAIQLEEERKRREKNQKIKRQIITSAIVVLFILGFMVGYSIHLRRLEIKALNKMEEALAEAQRSRELLQLVVSGKGGEYDSTEFKAIVDMLRYKQNSPIKKLITPMAKWVPVPGSKDLDFLVWIDVPSFRRDEIKKVEYKWSCTGLPGSVHLGVEPTLGFAFGYRGQLYCPHILINVEFTDKKEYQIDFDLEDYLKKHSPLN